MSERSIHESAGRAEAIGLTPASNGPGQGASERRVRRSAPVPTGINLALTAGFLASGAALILLLPAALAQQPAWGLLIIPFSLATPTLWALIHEAIHGHLHPRRTVNDLLGRALGILFGSPLQVLRVGHLAHHRLYASPPDGRPVRRSAVPRAVQAPLYYARIFGGVYTLEAAAALAVMLPRPLLVRLLRQAVLLHPMGASHLTADIDRTLLSGPALWRSRLDGLLIVSLYGAGLLLYGPHAWMMLAALLVRGAIVSFMDNLYHHVPAGASRRTADLALPAWASAGILHANFHAVHHRRPGLPWRALPAASGSTDGAPARGFVAASIDQILRPAV